MDKKYFFFDIDGTLAYGISGHKVVPESAKYTLAKLQENGHFVAIATGRSYPMAIDTMKELNIHNMVHDGGNGITINNELLDVEPLDKDKCLALISECNEKNIPWCVQSEIGKTRYCDSKMFGKYFDDDYFNTVLVDNLNPSKFDKIYKLYISGDENKLESLKDLTYCRYHDRYFFVEPTQKEKGIYRIMDYFKVPIKDVVVFGDDLNDLSMFSDEWFCIAMGNGADKLKQKANYITDDVDKDGVYKACVHFGWIDE